MNPNHITVDNEGWTSQERDIVLFKDVPPNTPFQIIMFESDKYKILSTTKQRCHSHFNFFGESVNVYEIAYIGKIVEGKVVMFDQKDITYHDISAIHSDDIDCVLVQGVDISAYVIRIYVTAHVVVMAGGPTDYQPCDKE